jgi:hypothetical protein
MSGTGGAYGTKASDTDFRKKWDKEEYAERAKKKDQEERERMQENDERMKQGAHTCHTRASYELTAIAQGRSLGKAARKTCRSLLSS